MHRSYKDIRVLKEVECIANHTQVPISLWCLDAKNQGIDPDYRGSATVSLYSPMLFLLTAILPKRYLYFLGYIEWITALSFKIFSRPAGYWSIIHCHDCFTVIIGIIAAWTGRCSHVIWDAHELMSREAGLSRFESILALMYESFFASRVTILISVSDTISDFYRKTYNCQNILTILNAPIVYRPLNKQLQYHHSSKNCIRLVYCGNLTQGRGIDLLLRLCKYHNELEYTNTGSRLNPAFTFYGQGPLEEKISQFAVAYPNSINNPQYVDNKSLISELHAHDIGLCILDRTSMSYNLSLPNKFFEYFHAGLCIIHNSLPELLRISELDELGIYHINGMSEDEIAPDELLDLIHKCYEQFQRNHELVLKNRNKFSETFSWDNQCRKLSTAYKSLLVTNGY